ncbi:hypothetical protein H0A65_04735 [Alcaligenaceae bacterium]|nr:hypothetical protein [Alcaligenaceae bacterium]
MSTCYQTKIIGIVQGRQVVRIIHHRTPAKDLARWSHVPAYDGKAFRKSDKYDSEQNFDHFVSVDQGTIDLIELGLTPADRPQDIFPSISGPGEPIMRIPHATWWRAPNGGLIVWSDCYELEVDKTVQLLHAKGWSTETLPAGYAHWNRAQCIPVVGSSQLADAAWLKDTVLCSGPPQAA